MKNVRLIFVRWVLVVVGTVFPLIIEATPNYSALNITVSGSNNNDGDYLYKNTGGAWAYYLTPPHLNDGPLIHWKTDHWELGNSVGNNVNLGTGDLPQSTSNITITVSGQGNNVSANCGAPDSSTTEPVNTINGGMFFDESDFGLSGAGFNLEWTRSYNSALNSTNGLGYRWSHNYEWSLTPTTNVYITVVYTNSIPALLLSMGGGEARMLLQNNSNQCWESVQAAPLTIPFSTNGEYSLSLPSGYYCQFGTNGFIKAMSNAWNNTLAFNYTNIGGSVCLGKVTHSDGRALSFSYSSNRLVRVDTPSTNLCYLYSYNASGELTNAIKRLSSGDFLTAYTYDTNGVHAILQHKNALGEESTYAYQTNSSGQVTPVCTQVDVATNYYEHTVSYGLGMSTVTYAKGSANSVYKYYFDPITKLISRIDQPSDLNETTIYNYDPLLQVKTLVQQGQMVSQTNDDWPNKSYFLTVGPEVNQGASGYYYYSGPSFNKAAYTNSFYWGAFQLEWTGSQWRITSQGSGVIFYKINGSSYPDGGGWQQNNGSNVNINVSNICNAITTTNVFSPSSSRLSQYDSKGRTTQFYLNYSTVSSPAWTFTWNTNFDTLASATDPEGHRAEWDYLNGSVSVERIFPVTNQPATTFYSYGTGGILTAVTNANGHWVSYQSDAYGYPTQTVSQGGTTNWMTWDILGHLKAITLPSHVTDTNDPPNMIPSVISIDQNELGWIRKVTYPDSTFETFSFNGIGDLTNHIDVAGRTNNYIWLPTRKLSSATRYLTSGGSNQIASLQMSYNQQMNVMNIKDELERTVESYSLDLQDRPISVTNIDSQVMTVVWGLAGKVNQIVRFDGTTNNLLYDDADRVKQITYPDTTLSFGYYKNSLPMTTSNRWGVISNSFDGANRLVAQTQPVPSGNILYSYYPAGQISNVVSVGGTNAYAFDANERLHNLTIIKQGGMQDGLDYAYDSINGMLSQITYSNGLTCVYAYDIMNRLTGMTWRNISNQVLRSRTYIYTTAGMISRVNMEDGGRVDYSYDSLDRLTREKHTDVYGQVTSDEKYEFDLAGNRTKKLVQDSSGNTLMTVNYSLSSGNRLGTWSVAETDLVGRIDVAGSSSKTIGTNNRFGYLWVSNFSAGATSPQGGMKPSVYGTNFWAYDFVVGLGSQMVVAAIRDNPGNMAYTTNYMLMSVVTNAAYQYDLSGCLTNRQDTGKDFSFNLGLTWNGQYQLTAVSTNGVAVEQYGYDGAGRRIFIVEGGATNWMVYDGNQMVAEVDNSGNLKKSYIYEGLDRAVSMTTFSATTNIYYFLRDHLGSTMALTDGSGNIVESYRYDAWGRVLAVYSAAGSQIDESAVGNRILWQGREYSWKTGLYYFRARWYEPVTGRWLSNDPIGISGGLNQYVFCANNPVNFTDAFGLCEESSGLDWVQGGLDAVGVFDPFAIADGLNALIYLGRGQYGYASISAMGMIPYIGDLGKAGIYGVTAVNVTSKARSVERALETGEKFVGKGYKEVAPGVYRSADGARQFRMTGRDLTPTHGDVGPHVHFQKIDPITGREMKNIHTPLLNP